MNSINPNKGYDPKSLTIIFFALLSAQVAFLLYCMVAINPAFFIYEIENITYTLIPLAAILMAIISNRLFIQGLKNLSGEREISQALQKLQSIHIVRWALVEAASFLLLFFTIITSNHYFTAFALANIAYFITLKPRLFNFNAGLQP